MMTRKKGLHFFEIGDMVYPHPIIISLWKEAEENDHGIILEERKLPDRRKVQRIVKVFWQISQKMIWYEPELLYHLHHENVFLNKREEFFDIIKTREIDLNFYAGKNALIILLNRGNEKHNRIYSIQNPFKNYLKEY